MADVSKLRLGSEEYNIKDNEAREIAKNRAGVTTYGVTRFQYIDAVNGDDTNDGLCADFPIKTIDEYLKRVKSVDGIANWQCYLMGDVVYDIPSLVITAASPHFFPVNGSPTLNFSFTTEKQTSGPRFYSAHVALYGDENNRLKVNSTLKSLYFEGCSVSADHVDFLVPVRVYGGSLISTNCSYTTIAGEVGRWDSTNRCALMLQETNARLSDTEIKSTDGISTGIYVWSASNVSIYNALNVVNQTKEGEKPLIDIRASRGYIAPTTNLDNISTGYSSALNMNASIINTTDAFFETCLAKGLSRTNSSLTIGNSLMKNTGFIKGQTFNRASIITIGYTVSSGKEIRISIPFEYRVPIGEDISYNVSLSRLDVRAGGTSKSNMTVNSVEVVSATAYEMILKVTTEEALPNYHAAGCYIENLNISAV